MPVSTVLGICDFLDLEIVLKLAGNGLDFLWKFVENVSNISLNRSTWNNWVVLKRTDRYQVLMSSGYLVDVSQILPTCPANALM